jgi:hypothetical protein
MRNGLVGYWTFDGKNMSSTTAIDMSGTGNTGTLAGTTATSSASAGKIGQGFLFDGSNDSISVAYNSSLNLPDTGGAVSVWIKPTGVPVGQDSSQTIFKKRPHSNDNVIGGVALSIYQAGPTSSNYLRVQVGNDTVYDQLTASTTPLVNNKWYHVVLTYTSTTIYIYLNGNLEAQMARTRVITWPTALGVYIGTGKTATNPAAFKGTMDEFRMYNRTLSVTEIQSLYRAGGGTVMSAVSTATASSSSTGINSGLAGYWTLDRKNLTNATATDITGNGKNGTLSGSLSTANILNGKIREGLSFNGTSNYIDVGIGKFPYTSSSSFSGSLWVKTTGGTQTLMSNMDQGSVAGWHFSTTASGLNFLMANAAYSNLISVFSVANVNDGRWHHVGFTYDGSHTAAGVVLYIDGKQTDKTINNNVDPGLLGDYGFKIGVLTGFGGLPFAYMNGSMDDIRLYGRMVTATEMNTLYRQGGSTVAAVTNNNTPKVGINSGLVGYWTFDGKNMTNATATDSSGNSFSGTLVGTTATSSVSVGKVGQAINFSKNGDYIAIASSGLLNTVPNTGTVSTWFYMNSTPGNNAVYTLVRKQGVGNPASVAGYTFDIYRQNAQSDGFLRGALSDGFSSTTTLYPLTIATKPTIRKWNHGVFSWNGTVMSIYLNNILVATTTQVAIVPFTATQGVYLGTNSSDFADSDVRMDDTRIYNRALSVTEIQSLYKLGAQ